MENLTKIKIGQKIYYRGDCANHEHFGTVTDKKIDKWGGRIEITPEIESGAEKYWINLEMISSKDSGNCSTPFVTIEAYNKLRNEKIKSLEAYLKVS